QTSPTGPHGAWRGVRRDGCRPRHSVHAHGRQAIRGSAQVQGTVRRLDENQIRAGRVRNKLVDRVISGKRATPAPVSATTAVFLGVASTLQAFVDQPGSSAA